MSHVAGLLLFSKGEREQRHRTVTKKLVDRIKEKSQSKRPATSDTPYKIINFRKKWVIRLAIKTIYLS